MEGFLSIPGLDEENQSLMDEKNGVDVRYLFIKISLTVNYHVTSLKEVETKVRESTWTESGILFP